MFTNRSKGGTMNVSTSTSANLRNMSAFTRLRDTDPVFDRCKRIGDVGIPAFVLEDGSITLDPADVGLIEYGTELACSLEDHKNGRKGC